LSAPAETLGEVPGPPLPPGRYVELPGRGRTFIRDAAGPPGAPVVLLLHGLSATADLNWFPAYPRLAARYRVIGIDHRGHGRGIRSRRRFRLSDCADDAAALAHELRIPRLVAVGYSMGGPIAQLLWRRHPQLVQGLVLCATSRDFRGHPRERMMFSLMPGVSLAARLTPATVRRRAFDRVLATRRETPGLQQWAMQELRRSNPAAVAEAAAAIGQFSSRDWIGHVDVPTAVIVTEQDQLVPPHRQLKLAEAITGATVHPVRGDHAACVLRADRFVPTLREAVDSVVARAQAQTRR
jgi:3-oxoadipate enol-lactonase